MCTSTYLLASNFNIKKASKANIKQARPELWDYYAMNYLS